MDELFMECHRKLMKLGWKIIGKSRQDLNQLGFAWNQYNVMKNINPGEALTLSEISERAAKRNSNVTSIIDFLENKGIVRRLPDENDRRVIRVALTEEGREIRQQMMKRHEDYLENLYGDLSENEMREFIQIADIFLDKVR